MEVKLSLKIDNITVNEAKQIMNTVRAIERKDESRLIFCKVEGLEERSVKEVLEITKEIFPGKKIGG